MEELIGGAITFKAIEQLFLRKKIELFFPSHAKFTMEDIPVLVSPGATFYEVYSSRTDELYFFNPDGICSPGEVIIIPKEELVDFIEHKRIDIIKR